MDTVARYRCEFTKDELHLLVGLIKKTIQEKQYEPNQLKQLQRIEFELKGLQIGAIK